MGFMSAVGSMAKDAGESALGIVSKALLILNTDVDSTLGQGTVNQQTLRMLAGVSSSLKEAASASGYHKLEVQYNPNTISIQANAKPTPFQYLQQNIDSGIPTQNFRDPSVVLSVELTFDAMNPKDAFMLDKLRISAGDAVSAVSGVVKNLTGNGYTVQPQTNGLIAALIRDSTRSVTFKWADMSFTGELTEASATYTMFSVSGKPIRSVVHLNITQQVNMESDISYWDKAFDRSFGEKDNASTSGGRSFANRYGNLLNIGF